MNLHSSKFFQAVVLSTILLASANVANADEFAGKQWPANEQVSIDQISHQSFDTLLKKYVDEDGMVDYRAWHQNQTDRDTLKSYLENLSKANPNAKAANAAKLAYWINAYNALTIEGILRVYPTTSIRNHTAKLFGYNIWKKLFLYVGSSKINLNDIEHKVLRSMNEPRIHFAIVCASIGCPRLLNSAYTADQLENQLATNTTDFFSRSRNLVVDAKNSKLHLSAIMNWFGSDFGDSTTEQIKAIGRYLPDDAKTLVTKGKFSVGYLDYNWNLNSKK